MTAYYNEFDPFAAAWLRELIKDGHIAPGDVDERSIVDVRPADLAGYDQCHFFAGIGVWSLALRGAGWSDDRPVWTGSCPCQPFSAAGKGAGFADERHLWPAFFNLIRECRPDVVLGEQVASKDGLAWLDLVHADLEGADYACGAVDTCAAGFGAPHIRQRLYWVGSRMENADLPARERQQPVGGAHLRQQETVRPARRDLASGLDLSRSGAGVLRGQDGRLAQSDDAERRSDLPARDDHDGPDAGRAQGAGHAGAGGGSGGMANEQGSGRREERADGRGVVAGDRAQGLAAGLVNGGCDHGLADAGREQRLGRTEAQRPLGENAPIGGESRANDQRCGVDVRPGPTNGLWAAADWLGCRDGKWRPVEPGTFPLAHAGAYRNRVGLLRGAGNAVNLAQAQAFCEAVKESI